ncbi:hypothetical protein SAMN06265365_12263 [Tistlia consotensis]|uniref:Uncharacterized protein n=1 Tax=Tistlia consotensis USBA 355 TaxID=560819 RepID=A0A1Y6CM79_9PROT|nr:hypothetical protein [Tistlia consotensis]SMF63021.1 hypothetical protein SAMN05428998_12463 [Tistlia consotensis USBA 355]SNR95408.1 hypothetical protein SAMN06265365_12263 [Tistlia consotensis]
MGRALRGFLMASAVALAVPLLPALAIAQGTTPTAPGNGQAAPGTNPAANGAPGSNDPQIQALIQEAERTRPVPTELLNALAMGKGDAKQMIDNFLADGNPLPHTVAVRAVALSLAVGRDPRLKDSDKRFALNQTISDGMSKSLGAPRILNVKVDAGFVPPKGTFAWALGGLEDQPPEGFQKLTQFSPEVGGLGMQSVNNAGEGGVVKEAIENLQSVSLKVPNGQYRVILLTGEQLAARAASPFGETFKVNGVEYTLGQTSSGEWFDTAHLRGSGGNVVSNVSYGAAGLSVVVQVGNGTLNLEFKGGKGSLGSALSGILMEPVEVPSHLDMSGVRGHRNEVAQTQDGQDQQGGQQVAQTQQVSEQLQQAGQQQLQASQQAAQSLAGGTSLAQQLSLNNVVELEFQTQAAIAAVSGVSPGAGGQNQGNSPQAAPVPAPQIPTPPPSVSPAG